MASTQASLLLNNSDAAVSNAAMGINTARANAASNAVQIPSYVFQEPKTGFFAAVLPSESTWHPLFVHSYYELGTNKMAIDNQQIDQSQKDILHGKVRDITIQSYKQAAMARVYQILIIGTILLIILLYLGKSVALTLGVTVVLAIIAYIYAEVWAEGRGTTYWQEFSADWDSKRYAGEMPHKILEGYAAADEKAKDRAALMAQRGSGYSPGMGTGFMAGVGAGVGNSLIKNVFQ